MEYSRFAIEEMPGFHAAVVALAPAARIAVAWRLDCLRRGRIGEHRALGGGVFELHLDGLPPAYVHRRAARVTAVCLGGGARRAQVLAARNGVQARHPAFDAARYLGDARDAAAFLELAIAGGEHDDVIEALQAVARARGVALRPLGAKADLAAVVHRVAALGLRLHIAPADA